MSPSSLVVNSTRNRASSPQPTKKEIENPPVRPCKKGSEWWQKKQMRQHRHFTSRGSHPLPHRPPPPPLLGWVFFPHSKERNAPPWARKPHRIGCDDEKGSGKNEGKEAGRKKGWVGR